MPTSVQDDTMITPTSLARDLDSSFPAFVLEYQNGIYSGIRRLVPAAADAEDLTQETFIRAYRALRGYPTERIQSLALSGWLWTIALNLCRNEARRRTRKPTGAALQAVPEPASQADTAEDAIATLQQQEWHDRLGKLSLPMRTAVVLRHVVGLPYRDVAEATGRPVGTVKADVHRGIARLREMLDSDQAERP